MHYEILNKQQVELLPYLKHFQRTFYLVGGTAIALHIGHRRSIDFDLFTTSKLVKYRIKSKLNEIPFKQMPLFEDYDQLHLHLNNVKLTFFSFPFPIAHPVKVESVISMPSLLSLASMKAFALERRSKWKDYVDLFFILKNYHTIQEISNAACTIFPSQFSEKLFREQLAFFKDIDFSEPVEFVLSPVPEDEIKQFLTEKALEVSF
ncbi:MAG TPA: nucleotidyl transferase AbiEii/AbiGii toxin family protein [Bacteroidales bacterium]|nr:nucleotidyl transferase AbiEii/AbiGii toxin family protein [Bacteroidales bacterium]